MTSLSLLFSPLFVHASDTIEVAPAQTLSSSGMEPSRAVEAIVATHPLVREARARYEASGFLAEAAAWGRYPSPSLVFSRDDDGRRETTLALTQPLWAGGRIDGEISASEARQKAAHEALREAELIASEEVAGLLVEISRGKESRAAAAANIAAHDALVAAIERRTEGGIGSQPDVLLARARKQQAQALLAQTTTALRRAEARFAALAGGRAAPGLAAEPFDPRPAAGALFDAAEGYSPTLLKLQAEALAAEHETEIARAVAWPQLSLRGERIDRNFGIPERDNRALLIVEYQPGSGLGAAARAKAAIAQRDATLAAGDRAHQELRQRIASDVEEYAALLLRIDALTAVVESNTGLVEAFMRQYAVGRRSWIDVLNTQNEFSASQQQLIEARYAAVAARTRLALITGRFFTSHRIPN